MDFRSRILAAIDRLQSRAKPVTALEIQIETAEYGNLRGALLLRELRNMAKAGTVVYDRKASGWRRS